ncbi:MAG: aromatic acid decarboxylase [Planctomycetota bacterium]|nr:MAG: aromatic acid decarboxylase [Planctomycetota bacterium]
MSGRVLVALTGASGAVYGVECVRRLAAEGVALDVIVSDAARRVLAIEHDLGPDPREWVPASKHELLTHDVGDIAAAPASGSRAPRAMLVVPCSMGTAARIAAGLSSNLIERAADVVLKQRRPLVVVPRETPLSAIHLRNLLTLAELGVAVVPAMPAFYTQPTSVQDMVAFVVDRALAMTGLELPLRARWQPPGQATP